MARRLRGIVHVRDDMGAPHVFGPDDDVPGWAESRISNPAAWADGAPLPSAPSAPARPAARPEAQAAPEPAADEPPPQGGPGSSTSAWAAYARRNGVTVPAGSDRSEIIAACERAGVPVE